MVSVSGQDIVHVHSRESLDREGNAAGIARTGLIPWGESGVRPAGRLSCGPEERTASAGASTHDPWTAAIAVG